MRCLLFIALCFLLFSCNSNENTDSHKTRTVELKYANGFTVEKIDDLKILTINNAWRGEKTNYKYVLYKNDLPKGFDNATKIKIPIKKIACLSLTHIAFIDALNQNKSIVAASGCNYTDNPEIRKLVNSGDIVEVESQEKINYEVLVEKDPDIVMTYGINEGSLKYLDKMKELGLTIVLNSEYMEVHPLGKAEWIKFVGAFYDEDEKADSLFNKIEEEYKNLVDLTKDVKVKPSVFVGMPWNGNWYVAGGKSFQAQLFKDAGATYLWSDNDEFSSVVKSKEVVYDEAFNADFWLNLNSYKSIYSVLEYDNRLENFKTVRDSNIYNNDKRVNKFSGNDYWESGTINPQIILKDLIQVFHPELLNHELYYYRRMK